MVRIGCAGFPVPATRYFKELSFVEVQGVLLNGPGVATLRRWRREAPRDFDFSVLAPREIGQQGYRDTTVSGGAMKSLALVAQELGARTAVFTAPDDFALSRPNRSAVREFLASAKRRFARVVWEAPPSWDPAAVRALASASGATLARDPMLAGSGRGKDDAAYYRLPGPAGHKSRYEEPAIERLAEMARAAEDDSPTYVFTNVDMFADAKRLMQALRL